MIIWGPKRIQMEKVVNYKVLQLFKTYNFYIGSSFIRGHLKKFEFQIWEIQT